MDNTNEQQKLRVRETVTRFPVSRALCVETNAGLGTMTRLWSKLCDRVICYDTDLAKLRAITASELPNVQTMHLSNRTDTARQHYLTSEIVDIDPHGDPWEIIRDILRNGRTPQVYIAFTDGSWWERKWNRDARRSIEHKLLELPAGVKHHIERVERGGVLYYGWIYYQRGEV